MILGANGYRRALIAGAAGVALVAALMPGQAQAVAFDGWCGTGGGSDASLACFESVTRNGTPVTSADPTYELQVVESTVSGTWQVNWSVQNRVTGAELGAGDLGSDWQVTLNTRAHKPRFAFAHSTAGAVNRSEDGSGDNVITVTGSPVALTQGCLGDGTCPATATTDWTAYIDGWVYDAQWYAGSGVPASAWNGSNMWTNIDWTEFPPSIIDDGLLLRVANSHFRTDGVTPVSGFLKQDLPYPLVKQVLGIDDPASLAAVGLVTTLSGSGAGTVTVSDGVGIINVDATGISFSKRKIKVKQGIITPRRGVLRSARRGDNTSVAALRFKRGVARGSKIKRYQGRCYTTDGHRKADVVTGYVPAGKRRVVKMQGVPTFGKVLCQVRVKSKAGFGRWSEARRLR